MKPFRKMIYENQPFIKTFTKTAKAETHHKIEGNMKPFIKSIFAILLVVFLLPQVKAGFACGQVQSIGDVEPQWMDVHIYYNNNYNFSSCSVSPAENKFCCDAEAIPGFGWGVGKEISAEIYDDGYFTEPVSLQISGEGYDVFPLMILRRAITINNSERVVFGNSFLLNASFAEPYTYVELERDGEREFLYNGTEYEGLIELEPGMNYMKLIASGEGRTFSEDLIVASLQHFDFNRRIDCKKCNENLIKQNQQADIKIELNLSHYIENLELREYVPVDFEILETNGHVEEYSETHNVIIWNVGGKEIIREYKIKAPKVVFFPVKYIFRTELEEEVLNESEVVVSRFFSFWSFEEEMEFKDVKRKVYSRISPKKPIVVRTDRELVRLGLIPKQTIRNAELKVEEYQGEELENAVSYYSLDTNIPLEDIDKIFIEFRINKTINLSLYFFEDTWKEWEESDFEVREDEEFVYYKTYIPPTKKIALVGEEESFWDFLKIFN